MAILAALSFNNWLLGLVLNHNLFFKGGAVSEFSALDQPHQLVFRILDVTSGVLFVILAVLLAKIMPRVRGYRWLIFGAVALGISNAVDATQPLTCSETLSKSCSIPVQVSLHHLTIPSHGYSSVSIAICYLLLPVAGWVWANQIKSKNFKIISMVLSLVAVGYLTAAVIEYLVTGSFSEKAWGPTQEVQMLLLGTWFVYWARATGRLTKASTSS